MNIVLFWNSILLECSRRDFTRGFFNAQQPGPIRTSRAMAIVHLAIHDAVAFETGNAGAAYLKKKAIAHMIGAPPAGSGIADTVAGAAVTALKALYPRYADFIDDSHGGSINAAYNYGRSIADALLAARAGDGSNVMVTAPQDETLVYGQHRADPFAPNQPRLGLPGATSRVSRGQAVARSIRIPAAASSHSSMIPPISRISRKPAIMAPSIAACGPPSRNG